MSHLIELKNISYVYSENSPYETVQLSRCADKSQFEDREKIEDAYFDRIYGEEFTFLR